MLFYMYPIQPLTMPLDVHSMAIHGSQLDNLTVRLGYFRWPAMENWGPCCLGCLWNMSLETHLNLPENGIIHIKEPFLWDISTTPMLWFTINHQGCGCFVHFPKILRYSQTTPPSNLPSVLVRPAIPRLATSFCLHSASESQESQLM